MRQLPNINYSHTAVTKQNWSQRGGGCYAGESAEELQGRGTAVCQHKANNCYQTVTTLILFRRASLRHFQCDAVPDVFWVKHGISELYICIHLYFITELLPVFSYIS